MGAGKRREPHSLDTAAIASSMQTLGVQAAKSTTAPCCELLAAVLAAECVTQTSEASPVSRENFENQTAQLAASCSVLGAALHTPEPGTLRLRCLMRGGARPAGSDLQQQEVERKGLGAAQQFHAAAEAGC